MLGRAVLGGDDEVTLVFTILIIHDDDHLAVAEIVDQFLGRI